MQSLFQEGDFRTGALFSPCRTWRYALWRSWSAGSRVAFIGVNPSTADEHQDDPTIRRCIGFAKHWGYDGLVMLNLFAYRTPYPSVMKVFQDPIGPDNDSAIERLASACSLRIAAWGVNGTFLGRDETVKHMMTRIGKPLSCLGRTAAGHPRHPLYVPKTAVIEGYQ